MLQLNPDKRISIYEALNHPYFRTNPLPCTLEEIPRIEKECHEFNIRQAIEKNKKRRQEEALAQQKLLFQNQMNPDNKLMNFGAQPNQYQNFNQIGGIGQGFSLNPNRSALYQPYTVQGKVTGPSGVNFNKYAPPGFKIGQGNNNVTQGNVGGINKLNEFLKR